MKTNLVGVTKYHSDIDEVLYEVHLDNWFFKRFGDTLFTWKDTFAYKERALAYMRNYNKIDSRHNEMFYVGED